MAGLEHANVVVLARQFNPSILSEHWLIKHGIVSEEDEEREQIAVPGLVNFKGREFAILAAPDRVQFAIMDPEGNGESVVQDKFGRIIERLPETPYHAVGLNFHWGVTTTAIGGVEAGVRAMFAKDDSRLYAYFDEGRPRFGGYLSRDVLGFRMSLDVKPTEAETDGSPAEGLLYQFNFHRAVGEEDRAGQIKEALSSWAKARELSGDIFRTTTGWLRDDD